MCITCQRSLSSSSASSHHLYTCTCITADNERTPWACLLYTVSQWTNDWTCIGFLRLSCMRLTFFSQLNKTQEQKTKQSTVFAVFNYNENCKMRAMNVLIFNGVIRWALRQRIPPSLESKLCRSEWSRVYNNYKTVLLKGSVRTIIRQEGLAVMYAVMELRKSTRYNSVV